MVGWAFALAASTFCPLFLLGIWWSRLTAQGAAAGIIVGGVLAIGAILAGALIDAQSAGGAVNALLTQPAIISVPFAFAAMIAVSLVTASPKDVSPRCSPCMRPRTWASRHSSACGLDPASPPTIGLARVQYEIGGETGDPPLTMIGAPDGATSHHLAPKLSLP